MQINIIDFQIIFDKTVVNFLFNQLSLKLANDMYVAYTGLYHITLTCFLPCFSLLIFRSGVLRWHVPKARSLQWITVWRKLNRSMSTFIQPILLKLCKFIFLWMMSSLNWRVSDRWRVADFYAEVWALQLFAPYVTSPFVFAVIDIVCLVCHKIT